MILCDTNILIEFYKNNTNIIQELRQIGSQNLTISIIITRAELYYGAINKNELNRIQKHLDLLPYPHDPNRSSGVTD
jgi:tRNA(fMet)-specific endonuclease VapC